MRLLMLALALLALNCVTIRINLQTDCDTVTAGLDTPDIPGDGIMDASD